MRIHFQILLLLSGVLTLLYIVLFHRDSKETTDEQYDQSHQRDAQGFNKAYTADVIDHPDEDYTKDPTDGIQYNLTSTTNQATLHVKADLPPIDTAKEWPDLDQLWKRLVIVTAFSENHVAEAKGMIASVQMNMPGQRIVVYDLGIKPETIPKVNKLCGLEVRDFNFSKYPEHTKNLHTFAWKVFIIRETLHEFGAIFWGDASVRFSGSLRDVLPYLHLHHGFMTHIHSYDPKVKSEIKHQYYFTYPKQFEELGVSREDYYADTNASPHLAANRQLYINNSVIIEKVLEPLTKCALTKQCIAPKGSRKGNHRFDASALAIIVYKNMKYEWTPQNQNTTSNILDNICTTARITKDAKFVKSC